MLANDEVNVYASDCYNKSIGNNCKIIKLRETPKDYDTTYRWKHTVIPELIALGCRYFD